MDSAVFVSALALLHPARCSLSVLAEPSHHKRADRVVAAAEGVGLAHALTADDILQGAPAKSYVFLLALFARFCGHCYMGGCAAEEDAVHRPAAPGLFDRLSAGGGGGGGGGAPPPPAGPLLTASEVEELLSVGGCCSDSEAVGEVSRLSVAGKRGWQYMEAAASQALLVDLYGGRDAEDLLDHRQQRMRGRFLGLSDDRLLDVLMCQQNAPDEVERCVTVFSRCFPDVAAIYSFYSAVGGTPQMTPSAFLLFASDSKITPAVSKRAVETHLQRVLKTAASAGGTSKAAAAAAPKRRGKEAAAAGDGAAAATSAAAALLTPVMFVELLCRIAFAKHRGRGVGLSEAVELLLAEGVLSGARRTCVRDVQRQMRAPAVQRVVGAAGAASLLRRAFAQFAQPLVTDEDGERLMGAKGFHRFTVDADLIDTRLTFNEAAHVFNTLAAGPAKAVLALTHTEFVHAVACMACYRHPSPLVPLGQKLQVFLTVALLPKLRDKLGVS